MTHLSYRKLSKIWHHEHATHQKWMYCLEPVIPWKTLSRLLSVPELTLPPAPQFSTSIGYCVCTVTAPAHHFLAVLQKMIGPHAQRLQCSTLAVCSSGSSVPTPNAGSHPPLKCCSGRTWAQSEMGSTTALWGNLLLNTALNTAKVLHTVFLECHMKQSFKGWVAQLNQLRLLKINNWLAVVMN